MKYGARAVLLVVSIAVVALVCVPVAGATEAPAGCVSANTAPVFAP